MDRKQIRKITGYTYDHEKCNPKSWYECALSFHESAIILYGAEKSTSRGTIATVFNAALSLELIIKAILAAKSKDIITTHKLRNLAEDADIYLNDDQKYMVDYLTETIIWLKYPSPKSENAWDQFHDVKFERLVIRSKSGNTYRTMANLKRIPSLENYMKLWDICLAKYKESVNE